MISITNATEFCDDDITKIENYEAAISSQEQWDCHHRLEVDNGVVRSRQQLIDSGLYYSRPPSELIFLTHCEHMSLHMNNRSDETLRKLSLKSKGHVLSEDARRKISEARKRDPSNYQRLKEMCVKSHTPETIRKQVESRRKSKAGKDYSNSFKKISIANTGKHWWNNGVEERFEFDCPDGFRSGRLPVSVETRMRLSQSHKSKEVSHVV